MITNIEINMYKASVFHGCGAKTRNNRTKMQFQSKGLYSHLTMTILCDVRAHVRPPGINGEERAP